MTKTTKRAATTNTRPVAGCRVCEGKEIDEGDRFCFGHEALTDADLARDHLQGVVKHLLAALKLHPHTEAFRSEIQKAMSALPEGMAHLAVAQHNARESAHRGEGE